MQQASLLAAAPVLSMGAQAARLRTRLGQRRCSPPAAGPPVRTLLQMPEVADVLLDCAVELSTKTHAYALLIGGSAVSAQQRRPAGSEKQAAEHLGRLSWASSESLSLPPLTVCRPAKTRTSAVSSPRHLGTSILQACFTPRTARWARTWPTESQPSWPPRWPRRRRRSTTARACCCARWPAWRRRAWCGRPPWRRCCCSWWPPRASPPSRQVRCALPFLVPLHVGRAGACSRIGEGAPPRCAVVAFAAHKTLLRRRRDRPHVAALVRLAGVWVVLRLFGNPGRGNWSPSSLGRCSVTRPPGSGPNCGDGPHSALARQRQRCLRARAHPVAGVRRAERAALGRR